MEKMTPEQALEVLYQMARRAMGNATDHETVQNATVVLRDLIKPDKKAKE